MRSPTVFGFDDLLEQVEIIKETLPHLTVEPFPMKRVALTMTAFRQCALAGMAGVCARQIAGDPVESRI